MAFLDTLKRWPLDKPLPADGGFFFFDKQSNDEYSVLPEQVAAGLGAQQITPTTAEEIALLGTESLTIPAAIARLVQLVAGLGGTVPPAQPTDPTTTSSYPYGYPQAY
ncbi:hypothetical protein [Hymenobacter nivis]|uniref:Uncharacterized protein n=1 Tax=Hymenobacter nivis TaxID=1850093 RepID=A0A502GUL4_9BACT|nr:hypothetical protein [Hymenobacter nivis]TPG66057.1 hypothetical protein EAH73_11855 [Hymenobacter nivis]